MIMASSQPLALDKTLSSDSTTPTTRPKHLSIPLPLSPHTKLHIQITHRGSSILAFLTTTDPSNTASLAPLGSFVYAMPNVCDFVALVRFTIASPSSLFSSFLSNILILNSGCNQMSL